MEIGILYVGGPMVLGRQLPAPSLAKTGWTLMTGSAILAILAGAAFVAVAVGSLLFGDEVRPSKMLPDYSAITEADQPSHAVSMRGTGALTASFLLVLGILYGLDWMWLAQLWEFGL